MAHRTADASSSSTSRRGAEWCSTNRVQLNDSAHAPDCASVKAESPRAADSPRCAAILARPRMRAAGTPEHVSTAGPRAGPRAGPHATRDTADDGDAKGHARLTVSETRAAHWHAPRRSAHDTKRRIAHVRALARDPGLRTRRVCLSTSAAHTQSSPSRAECVHRVHRDRRLSDASLALRGRPRNRGRPRDRVSPAQRCVPCEP